MSIYTAIPPTYLYIKQHSVTGLKYFGKTTQDPYKYLGSGKYWTRHIKKHGKEHINTLWVSELYTNKELVSELALFISEEYNIVKSKEWANLIPENGFTGNPLGNKASKETKKKMSISGTKQNNKRVENGTHNLVGINNPTHDRIKNGTYHALGPDANNKRIENGTHNWLGPDGNNKRIENGTHNFVNRVSCKNKQGIFVQVSKDIYDSQSGNKSDWEYVSINSVEGKKRNLTIELLQLLLQ